MFQFLQAIKNTFWSTMENKFQFLLSLTIPFLHVCEEVKVHGAKSSEYGTLHTRGDSSYRNSTSFDVAIADKCAGPLS